MIEINLLSISLSNKPLAFINIRFDSIKVNRQALSLLIELSTGYKGTNINKGDKYFLHKGKI